MVKQDEIKFWDVNVLKGKSQSTYKLKRLAELVGHSVSWCLYRVQLDVLSNLSATTCTLKTFSEPAIHPTIDPLIMNSNQPLIESLEDTRVKAKNAYPKKKKEDHFKRHKW